MMLENLADSLDMALLPRQYQESRNAERQQTDSSIVTMNQIDQKKDRAVELHQRPEIRLMIEYLFYCEDTEKWGKKYPVDLEFEGAEGREAKAEVAIRRLLAIGLLEHIGEYSAKDTE